MNMMSNLTVYDQQKSGREQSQYQIRLYTSAWKFKNHRYKTEVGVGTTTKASHRTDSHNNQAAYWGGVSEVGWATYVA